MIKEKFIDFETERESWNRYELIENAQLKAKVVLMKAIERKDPKNPKIIQIGIESKNIVTILPMKSFKLLGERTSRIYSAREISSAQRIDVSFDQVSEDWNIYRLEDGRKLKVKLVVSDILRLKGLTDTVGIPIYDIGSTVLFNVIGKKR